MSEWWNVDSQQRCDAGVGFMSGLISHAPIIACGGHRSPLHGRGGAALIRGEADWIPQSWKIETRGATTDSEWPLVSDTDQQSSLCVFGGCNFIVWCTFFFCVSWKGLNNLWSDVIRILNQPLSSRCRSRVSQWRNPQSEIKEIVYFNFIFYIQLQGYSQLWHVT